MQPISDTSSRKRFRERCANELAVRKACSFQRGFLQVYVRTVAVLQNAVDERGAPSAMPLMRQPVKRQFERQPREVALRQREVFKQDELTSVSSSAACENSAAEIGARSIAVVACCVSYQHGV